MGVERYDEDGSVEWMDLPKEPAIVARQVVWVKMRSHPWWPAQVLYFSVFLLFRREFLRGFEGTYNSLENWFSVLKSILGMKTGQKMFTVWGYFNILQ